MKKKKSVDQTEELKNQLARALADYDNLRKRTEKEKEIIEKLSNARLVRRILPILDMLEEVQGHLKDPGLVIAITEFKKTLSDEGVSEIKADQGDSFNENKHEAVDTIKSKKEKHSGTIAEVVNSGWEIDDVVIRPVKVIVYT